MRGRTARVAGDDAIERNLTANEEDEEGDCSPVELCEVGSRASGQSVGLLPSARKEWAAPAC
jgi:hypothetical protein